MTYERHFGILKPGVPHLAEAVGEILEHRRLAYERIADQLAEQGFAPTALRGNDDLRFAYFQRRDAEE